MQNAEIEALAMGLANQGQSLLDFEMPLASSGGGSIVAMPVMPGHNLQGIPAQLSLSGGCHAMSQTGAAASAVDMPCFLAGGPLSMHMTMNSSRYALPSLGSGSGQAGDGAETDSSQEATMNGSGNGRFPCPICLKQLSSNWYRKIHMRVHTGEGLLPCLHCGKNFPSEARLAVHLRVHTGEKPFPCGTCGKRFAQKGTLNAHLRVHTGEKPFICGVCGKGFSRRQRHAAHMTSHSTPSQLVPCPFCARRMPNNKALQRHIGIHTGERTYSCDTCGDAFVNDADLDAHKLEHARERRFVCKVCGKSLSSSWYVKVHMRSHTGEGMLPCNDCGKLFPSTSRLKAHRRIHTGEKPFKCDYCSKGYSRRTRLISHLRQHEKANRSKGRPSGSLSEHLEDDDIDLADRSNGIPPIEAFSS